MLDYVLIISLCVNVVLIGKELLTRSNIEDIAAANRHLALQNKNLRNQIDKILNR